MSNVLLTNVNGRNLIGNKFGDLVRGGSHIIIFLRHLGCNLAQQLVEDIKSIESNYQTQLPILFVSQGTRKFNDVFWEKRYPEAKVIIDTNLAIAKSFELREGSLAQVFNPKSMLCYLKAMGNGNLPLGPKGNIYMLPGIFVYVGGSKVYSHIAETASDLPDFEDLVKKYLANSIKDALAKKSNAQPV